MSIQHFFKRDFLFVYVNIIFFLFFFSMVGSKRNSLKSKSNCAVYNADFLELTDKEFSSTHILMPHFIHFFFSC